jgi:hypothetical protein
LQAELLGAGVAAPALSVSQEELLDRRIAVFFLIQVDILPFRIGQERDS